MHCTKELRSQVFHRSHSINHQLLKIARDVICAIESPPSSRLQDPFTHAPFVTAYRGQPTSLPPLKSGAFHRNTARFEPIISKQKKRGSLGGTGSLSAPTTREKNTQKRYNMAGNERQDLPKRVKFWGHSFLELQEARVLLCTLREYFGHGVTGIAPPYGVATTHGDVDEVGACPESHERETIRCDWLHQAPPAAT